MGWWQRLTGQETQSSPRTAADMRCSSGTGRDVGAFTRLLVSDDFGAVGVSGARSPTVNSAEPDSAYLVYAGKSGATGGIEFDVFYSDDPEQLFGNASCELVNPTNQAQALGADDAVLATGLDNGRGKWAAITVRKGRLVFSISIPDTGQAKEQLIALSRLVLARSGQV